MVDKWSGEVNCSDTSSLCNRGSDQEETDRCSEGNVTIA